MGGLKRSVQGEDKGKMGRIQPDGGGQEHNRGAKFGTTREATRGTDDADPSGESKNQGHGHPREERGRRVR